MLRRAVIVMAMVALGAAGAPPAWAHHSPSTCTRNALSLDITKDKTTLVRTGDVITYGVLVGNTGTGACDISGANVTFAVPGPTGAPGAPRVVARNLNLPHGTPIHQIATIRYQVPPITKVMDLVARSEAHGILHDAPTDHTAAIAKTLGTTTFAPAMVLTKTGSTTGGLAPQTVTYTYTLRNASTVSAALPDVPIANPAVADNLCAPLGYITGDVNGDKLLNVNETWVYTCTSLFTLAGTYVNTANATGTVTVDHRPIAAGPATWTVVVTAPPPPPQAAVRGATRTKPSRHACVSLASRHVKVRARELTTVKVRVRLNGSNIARSLVRVRGAGVRKSGRTNRKGMVTFRVRPKRTGRLTIHSDRCAVVARLSVKPARQVVAPALPEVTG